MAEGHHRIAAIVPTNGGTVNAASQCPHRERPVGDKTVNWRGLPQIQDNLPNLHPGHLPETPNCKTIDYDAAR